MRVHVAAMAASRSFSVQAMVRGYHSYKIIWEATNDGEMLACEREVGNIHDTFAVTMKKDIIIVGHSPRKISTLCSIFIRHGGSVYCEVSGTLKTCLKGSWWCSAFYISSLPKLNHRSC